MVRETKLEARIDGVSVQGFYDVVYADSSPIKRYHSNINACKNAVASPWIDGRRTVHFTVHLSLPAAFQKIAGAGPIPVREVQTVSWPDASCFLVVSEPELSFPGAANFPTSAEMTVRSVPGGVSLAVTVRCSACVPWVMQKTVEGLMVDQAAQSIGGFLGFCEMLVKEHLVASSRPPSVRPKRPARASDPVTLADGAVVVVANCDSASDGDGSSVCSAAMSAASDRERVAPPGTPAATDLEAPAAPSIAPSAAPSIAGAAEVVTASEASEVADASEAADASEVGDDEDDEFFDAAEDAERRQAQAQALDQEQQEQEQDGPGQRQEAPRFPQEQQQQQRQRRQQQAAPDVERLLESLAERMIELADAQINSHKLLGAVEARLRGVELDLARAVAYQEGQASALQALRGGGWGGGSVIPTLLATAVAASSLTALVLMRRKAG